MMYQFRNKKADHARTVILGSLIGLIIFFTLFISGIVSWSGGFFHMMGRPLWKAENAVKDEAQSSGYVLRTKASVFAENEFLKARTAELELAMADYQVLKSENEQLKDLLGRKPARYSFILGAILVKPSRSP